MCPDPTAAAVKCSRLFGGLLELGAVATTSMPQRNDLNGARGINEPVVQVIVGATQQYSAYAAETNIASRGPCVWLRGNELDRSNEFLANSAGRLRPVGVPPAAGFIDVACSTPREPDGKAGGHPMFRSSRRTSSAETVSPLSPSAMDSTSSASAAASKVNVSSPSRLRTVTTAPSGNGSPSRMIFPATTLPDVITIIDRF